MPATFDDVTCVSPTPTTSSSGDGMNDSRDFKELASGGGWSRTSCGSSTLDRYSESSDSLDNQSTTSSGGQSRRLQDFGSTELIPTRLTCKQAPKPAYNPMQFVKTGPTKLAQTAQEQIKKAEEVKKIREKKKDEAEDWQSNLEGWKSSRRKRQEHVIERVTEVKRMEQEEALKVSEAAAKRLVGMREKRGKLKALYSTEDNDEIEFSVSDSPPAEANPSPPPANEPAINKKAQPSPAVAVQEYTYDKAIEDYVKYTNTALSKSETTVNETRVIVENSTSSSSQQDKVVIWQAQTEAKVNGIRGASWRADKKQALKPCDTTSTPATEMPAATPAPESSVTTSAVRSAANRRSGEFSSVFKNRLSTFENPAPPPEEEQTTPAEQLNDKGAERADGHVVEEQVDFKAKLAAFRLAEKAVTPAVVASTPAASSTAGAARPALKPAPNPNKPVAAKRNPPPSVTPLTLAPAEPQEPIYANADVCRPVVATQAAAAAAATPHLKEPKPSPRIDAPPTPPTPLLLLQQASSPSRHFEDASDDCTEDEGIRSLSPHGTQSPTSPLIPAAPAESNADQTDCRSAFSNCIHHHQQPGDFPPASALPPINDSGGAFSAARSGNNNNMSQHSQVWDACDWLLNGSLVAAAAPPSEKPPPPPPPEDDDDDACAEQEAADGRAQQTSAHQYHHNQVENCSAGRAPAPADTRYELRKRRSDFLGFDSGHGAPQTAAPLPPPPPDVKSLIRATIAASAAGSNERPTPAAAVKRDDGAKVERSNSSGGVDAEIDQLAREWQADSMRSGWKQQQQLHQLQLTPHDHDHHDDDQHSPMPPEQDSIDSITPETMAPVTPPLAPPAKPSRLSAAPRSKLHDGEAWMAKRKVAVEPGGVDAPPPPKDVSRHWLIQEAEQRRIDAAQQRAAAGAQTPAEQQWPLWAPSSAPQSPSSSSSVNHHQTPACSGATDWLGRSLSSTSVDKASCCSDGVASRASESRDQSRSTCSLDTAGCDDSGGSAAGRPLYANQEEILQYADFSGPSSTPQIWQVRSLNSGSMDQLHHGMVAPSRPPARTHSKSVTHLAPQVAPPVAAAAQAPSTQTHPTWRSTQPPPEQAVDREPVAPLPHVVIQTLTQRMSQRNNNNLADYINVQEASMPRGSASAGGSGGAGPQVASSSAKAPPPQYRHPTLSAAQSVPLTCSSSSSAAAANLPPDPQQTDRMLSVSGRKKCSLCREELGRGAAMIIESLCLFYHIGCFRCCVCGLALGNGTAGTDVRVRNNHLHCHDCYSNDEGLKFSKV